jgi:hypothetical protein
MVAHAYNPNSVEVEAEGGEFETRLGYIMIQCLNKRKQNKAIQNNPQN